MVISPRVYSYSRWSTKEQSQGHSRKRQQEAAQRWAADHGFGLDESISILDDGLSAFRGDNTVDGGLGRFLSACRQGCIEPGSILLVESLDRISRMPPRRVQHIINEIVDSGVTIVTLSDNQHYTAEKLDRDPTALLLALLVSWRAHDESATKASRLSAAWAEKRRRIRASPGERLTRRGPCWLLPTADGGWAIDPSKSQIVRRIFAMTLAGMGEHRIAGSLNIEKVPPLSGGVLWHRSTISKILCNSAVIGRLTPGRIVHQDGRRCRVMEEPIDGAFPAIITSDDWTAVLVLKKSRARSTCTQRSQKHLLRRTSHCLAGITRCHVCGSTMHRLNKGSKTKSGHPKLVCSKARGKAGCRYVPVLVDAVDKAVLKHLPEVLDSLTNEAAIDGSSARSNARCPWTADESIFLGRIKQMRDVLACGEPHVDFDVLNAALKVLFKDAILNYDDGNLTLHWRSPPARNSTPAFSIRYAE